MGSYAALAALFPWEAMNCKREGESERPQAAGPRGPGTATGTPAGACARPRQVRRAASLGLGVLSSVLCGPTATPR